MKRTDEFVLFLGDHEKVFEHGVDENNILLDGVELILSLRQIESALIDGIVDVLQNLSFWMSINDQQSAISDQRSDRVLFCVS